MERPIYIKGKVFRSGGSGAIRASKVLLDSGVLNIDEEVTLVRVTPEIKDVLDRAYQQKALKTALRSHNKVGPFVQAVSSIVGKIDPSKLGFTDWSLSQPNVQPNVYY